MKSNSQQKKSIGGFSTNEELAQTSYSETTSQLRPIHMLRVVSQAFSSRHSQI